MVNLYVSLMIITATTVGKVMLCSVAGMVVCRKFTERQKSEKGLSFISMKIFLPCLLFSNLCLSVTWDQLAKFYWAPVLSTLPILLGFLSTFVLQFLIPHDYRYVLLLGCTFQNGLTFPISVLINLKGISWFDDAAIVDAQSYIFLYNIICSIGLWAIGDPMIAWAKAKEVEDAELAQEQQRALLATTRGRVFPRHAVALENRSFTLPYESMTSPTDPVGVSVTSSTKRDATTREQLQWYRPASGKDRPIVAAQPPASPVVLLDGEEAAEAVIPVQQSRQKNLRKHLRTVWKAIQSPPVMSSLLALLISLTPPLHWVAQTFVGEVIIGGMSLVGTGAIPLQLLVLGCVIMQSKPPDEVAPSTLPQQLTNSPAATGDADGVTVLATAPLSCTARLINWLTTRVSAQAIFTWSTVIIRLIIIPAICFLVIHLLRVVGVLPDERPFLLSMLVATAAPSAINSSLICAMHDYHARDYSRMIFCMYISSIFSATIWLFFYIVYLESDLSL